MQDEAVLVSFPIKRCRDCPHHKLHLDGMTAYYCEIHMMKINNLDIIHPNCRFRRMTFGKAHCEALRQIGRL